MPEDLSVQHHRCEKLRVASLATVRLSRTATCSG